MAADPLLTAPSRVRALRPPTRVVPVGLGLDSERARHRMVQRLFDDGVRDTDVLDAMAAVPRHLFVDPALASRAYEDVSLPIGHGQTISKPSIVARMLEQAFAPLSLSQRRAARVLEIGTGCGYQAAVLARLVAEVVTVERIRALHHGARRHLTGCGPARIRLVIGDGHHGVAHSAPFHAVVLAAAVSDGIPEALLRLIRVGGRLVAPVHGPSGQRLHLVERMGSAWQISELDAVRFVPMLAGVQ